MDIEARINAQRLAGALSRHAGDQAAVKRCAIALNYEPEQLRMDMEALLPYMMELERMVEGYELCES